MEEGEEDGEKEKLCRRVEQVLGVNFVTLAVRTKTCIALFPRYVIEYQHIDTSSLAWKTSSSGSQILISFLHSAMLRPVNTLAGCSSAAAKFPFNSLGSPPIDVATLSKDNSGRTEVSLENKENT